MLRCEEEGQHSPKNRFLLQKIAAFPSSQLQNSRYLDLQAKVSEVPANYHLQQQHGEQLIPTDSFCLLRRHASAGDTRFYKQESDNRNGEREREGKGGGG